MHEKVEELFRPVGAIVGGQFNISIAAATNQHVALDGSGDADLAGLVTAIADGNILELEADADVGYLWSAAASGGTVALTATATAGTAAQMCRRLFAGATHSHVAPKGTKGIIVISDVATILRITVASRSARYWTAI